MEKKTIKKKVLDRAISLAKNIAFWVVIAIVLGIVVGITAPDLAISSEFISKWFIGIIKVFIFPIIFLTIVLGIAGAGNLKQVGRIGAKALIYFEIISTVALVIGVAAAYFLQPGNIKIEGLEAGDASKYTSAPPPEGSMILNLLKENHMIQVLLASIIIGMILSRIAKAKPVIDNLQSVSKYVFKALHIVMYLAPFAAFSGIAYAVGKFGMHSLLPLGKLVLCVYATMFVFVFLILGPIMKYYVKFSIWQFLKNIKEELLLVWSTSSSEPAMPSLMQKLENMGCSKPVVGLVIPTGYSFNLDGTAIYLSMAVIFIAQLYNVPLSFFEMGSILVILMITSKGAAGVTGSGFIVLASTLVSLNKIPIEGLAFLLGVDKFMSEARALTNIIGNGVSAMVIAKSENQLNLNKEMSTELP
ncbi:MAG: cation:dicarboxylase symporter family transporter [Bacteroidota bacterium]